MGQALYRKYRSKSLSEIVGQEHITKTLERALKQGRISHAYLFTGPKGVGKTSIARILAHQINQLPYTDDSTHLDIIEIDAASNRRIDEIRDLRDKVYVAPTSAKYKVYIIDEVHMLTREAFNALLKTLEEPPEHVVFILATTDAHKLPETIVSRTQRFSFRPVEKEKVITHLADIAKKEKLSVTPEALELLAEHGEGSFRDSISLLDQASSHGNKLDGAAVRQLLGIPPAEAIRELLELVRGGTTPKQIMLHLNSLFEQGYQATDIAKQMSQEIRSELQMADSIQQSDLSLLDKLAQVPGALNPNRYLEISLLQLASHTAINLSPRASLPPETPAKAPEPPKVTDNQAEVHQKAAKVGAPPAKTAKATKAQLPLEAEQWADVLELLKKKHNTLYGVVRMAKPEFLENGTLRLNFAFAFHQKRINEPANRQKLANIIVEASGREYAIECQVDKNIKAAPSAKPVASEKPADISNISNIFGGGELLES